MKNIFRIKFLNLNFNYIVNIIDILVDMAIPVNIDIYTEILEKNISILEYKLLLEYKELPTLDELKEIGFGDELHNPKTSSIHARIKYLTKIFNDYQNALITDEYKFFSEPSIRNIDILKNLFVGSLLLETDVYYQNIDTANQNFREIFYNLITHNNIQDINIQTTLESIFLDKYIKELIILFNIFRDIYHYPFEVTINNTGDGIIYKKYGNSIFIKNFDNYIRNMFYYYLIRNFSSYSEKIEELKNLDDKEEEEAISLLDVVAMGVAIRPGAKRKFENIEEQPLRPQSPLNSRGKKRKKTKRKREIPEIKTLKKKLYEKFKKEAKKLKLKSRDKTFKKNNNNNKTKDTLKNKKNKKEKK